MAFSKGQESREGSIRRYTGVAPCKVIAINPNKAKLEEIYGREIENEPDYSNTINVRDRDVKAMWVNIYIKTYGEDGVELISKLGYNIAMCTRVNKDATKAQIIDEYGRTAWATSAEIKANAIPVYSNGKKANISPNYRVAYVGEEDLTNFLKCLVNIPEVQKYNRKTGEWSLVAHPEECLARLEKEDIEKIVKGDVSSLNDVVNLQPDNKVKILFGVKTSQDGKLYQYAYSRKVMRAGVQDFSKLAAEITEAKKGGAFADTEFSFGALKEYDPAPATFEVAPVVETPEAPVDFVDDLPM